MIQNAFHFFVPPANELLLNLRCDQHLSEEADVFLKDTCNRLY